MARYYQNSIEKETPVKDSVWSSVTNIKQRVPKDYIFPKSIPVTANLSKNFIGMCRWSYHESQKNQDCKEAFKFSALTQLAKGDAQLKVVLPSGEVINSDIRVRDRLILGLGDSFASGEGNPDIPTKLNHNYIDNLPIKYPDQKNGRWMKKVTKWKEKNATWLDKQCHRSLLSQHVLVSLRLAFRNAHESVTLLPLACSGAEVLDGLLTPQHSPPGGGEVVKESQVNVAIRELCPDQNILINKSAYLKGSSGSLKMKQMMNQDSYICKGEIRKPDAILLSIGGNDIGFARVIAWAVAADRGRNAAGKVAVGLTKKYAETICPYPMGKDTNGKERCNVAPPDASFRIKNWLPRYYEYLNNKFTEAGLTCKKNSSANDCAISNVYLTAYPTPLYLGDSQTLCDIESSGDANEQIRTFVPKISNPKAWQLRFKKEELSAISVGLIQPITKLMKQTSFLNNWNFVDNYLDTIKPHGVCVGYKPVNGKPQYIHTIKGKWYPISPLEEKAYSTDRQRWFRSPNDAVLFQTETDSFGIQGAYHPDQRVHAAIADSLYEEIDKNWTEIRQ